jgi:hypothetical protein
MRAVPGMSMKSIHEAVQKEIELQQLLNHAVQQKEIELRQLQKLLLNALYLVNRLLDADTETTEAGEAPEEFIGPEPAQPPESANLDAQPAAARTTNASQQSIAKEIESKAISGSPPRDIP